MSGYEASEDDTVGEIYEKLKCKLEKHKSDDIRTGFTNYGPHRDDIEIIINGKNARAFLPFILIFNIIAMRFVKSPVLISVTLVFFQAYT